MRRFDVVAICFVAFLLLSNIGATKLIGFDIAGWHLVFDGGAILFPLTYILGDVLSEVYGFAATRRVVITGFVVQFIASVTFWLVQIAPADDAYANQEAFEAVLGQVPRFVAASLLGFLAGQLLNSFVLVRIKERYGQGRLWVRLLGSSVVGESVDSVIFCTVAWVGNVPASVLLVYMVTGFVYKVAMEAVLLPFTYAAVAWVRRTDGPASSGRPAAGEQPANADARSEETP
ncbi:MAG: queuosine precursor transporter [Actinomycetaceae bacterium]|nr:queuosine precursor transporter [Actinomycetaceae bacterium]